MNMKKRILCIILIVFIMGMSFTGCNGQYVLWNKAHPFFSNLGGKWVGAVVNWICWIVPVYAICFFGDIIILNVIEFWSGSNPMALNTLEQTDENGTRITAVKNDDGTLSLTFTTITGETSEYLLERNGNDFSMFDTNGVLISSYNIESDFVAN